MKRLFSMILITVICCVTMASSAFAGEQIITRQNRDAEMVVIDEHALRQVYDRYANVTEEKEAVKMLMEDFNFTEAEAKELLEINKQAYSGPQTRASYIEGSLASSAPTETVQDIIYFIDFKELSDMAKITKFLAKQAAQVLPV